MITLAIIDYVLSVDNCTISCFYVTEANNSGRANTGRLCGDLSLRHELYAVSADNHNTENSYHEISMHTLKFYLNKQNQWKHTLTSSGAGHNKPRPLLPPGECNWLWAMAGDNKLTFDPPTRLPELTQNLIRSSYGHSTPSLKISCKSVQPFSRNVADKETKKQTKKEIERKQYRAG